VASKRARNDGAPELVEHRGRSFAITLGVGLTLLAIALVATLSQAAPRRMGTNKIGTDEVFGATRGGGTFCQRYEQIPAGTGAIRISLFGVGGERAPPVRVTVADGSRTLARGARPASHPRPSELIVVPLQTVLAHEATGRVCVTLGSSGGQLGLVGQATDSKFAARTGREPLSGRLRIEYLRPGRESWWSFASTVAHRIAIGHPLAGSSAVFLIVLLTLASIILGSWQLARRAT
jgi:hypothetical protein